MDPGVPLETRRPLVFFAQRPHLTGATFLLADLTALVLAAVISVEGRLWLGGVYLPVLYWRLWPVLGLFLLAYLLVELYPGIGIGPVEELRRASLATTLVYLILASATFLFRGAEAYSRLVFLAAWMQSLCFVPLLRALARHLLAGRRWWGEPVVLLGAGATGQMVARALDRRPGFGLKPIGFLDDDPDKASAATTPPVLGRIGLAPRLAREYGIRYAVVAMPGLKREHLIAILEQHGRFFQHLLVVPDLFGLSTLWVSARDLEGVLALEVRQGLVLRWARALKRLLDLGFTLVVGTITLPLLLLVALGIKVDSPGPVLFRQTRIGLGGRRFMAWKFRTMRQSAHEDLDEFLNARPDLREEWVRDQKLRRDPRVTRVGTVLRRTGLDELPQLWNVLRGEMSLVGPRPIVPEEVVRYGEDFFLYTQVLPGITGLWQVSGRSDLTYAQRIELDKYYVRNWSVWLDLYILARTVFVPFGKGAY